MKRFDRNISVLLLLLLVGSCSIDREGKANELYVQASSLIQGVKSNANDYGDILVAYNSAKEKINLLSSKYASTEIAVKLYSGQVRIADFNIDQFNKLEPRVLRFSGAEQSLTECTALILNDGISKLPESAMFVKINGAVPKNLDQLRSTATAQKIDLDFEGYRTHIATWLSMRKWIGEATPKDESSRVKSHSLDVEEIIKMADSQYKAELGDIDGALSSAQRIIDLESRVETYIQIVAISINNRSNKMSKENLNLIYEAVISATKIKLDCSGLCTFARAYSQVGDTDKANTLLSTALVKARGYSNPLARSSNLLEIAKSYNSISNKNEFTKLMIEAKEAANAIDGDSKSSTLLDVVYAYIQSGDLTAATNTIYSIQNNDYSDIAYAELACILFAENTYTEGLQMLEKITNTLVIDAARTKEVQILANQKRFEIAFQQVSLVEDRYLRAVALTIIANEQNKLGLKRDNAEMITLKTTVNELFPVKSFWTKYQK